MTVARTARYPKTLVNEVSPERLKRFFVEEGATYHVVKDLREMCIFSNHSVIRDPPFSRLDLISCRNLLIYLKPGLQGQVFPLFHYALRPGGYLFLGLSENIARYTDLFLPLDKTQPCLPAPRSGRPTPSTVSAVPAARRAERDRLGYRPERGTEALRPAAESGRHHRGPFCAGLCHRRRIRPGALFFRRHRKISAGCCRPAKPRYHRDGAPGIARRFTRIAASGQARGQTSSPRSDRGAGQRRRPNDQPCGRADNRRQRDGLWCRVHRSRSDRDRA